MTGSKSVRCNPASEGRRWGSEWLHGSQLAGEEGGEAAVEHSEGFGLYFRSVRSP